MKINDLYTAINFNDAKKVLNLLKQGVNPNIVLSEDDDASWGSSWGTLGDAISNITQGSSKEILFYLLEYGAEPDMSYSESSENSLNAAANYGHLDLNLIKFLLNHGVNPNKYDSLERSYPLKIDDIDDVEISKQLLLLEHGALYNDAENIHKLPRYNELHNATWNGRIKEIRLLLDYGADPMSIDDDGYMISYGNRKNMILDDVKLTEKEWQIILDLLNPNNPPYLKLGENEEDKYIIYENELIEKKGYLPHASPYLLSNKQPQKDKKYLYADNKADAFVYWAYKNNLLREPYQKAIDKYMTLQGEVNAKNIHALMTHTLGDTLTADMFNEEGKAFATSYLTVTHWWYNLHTDFNRLYQKEGIKLPRAIKSQEEFDTLLKLLDIRHEQFKSGKDFNSNQNKAELQALIEGKEPPKREVDLSFLEEELEESDTDKKGDDIIPDDYDTTNTGAFL